MRLGDTARELVRELREECHDAVLARGDAELQGWLEDLVRYLAGKAALPDLPCDIRATAFQRSVWEAIRSIPAGRTATYGEVAEAIGRRNASRAVANACGTNPIALLVPCHRVVPKKGGTGGYRWGNKRKKKLLILEEERA